MNWHITFQCTCGVHHRIERKFDRDTDLLNDKGKVEVAIQCKCYSTHSFTITPAWAAPLSVSGEVALLTPNKEETF